MYTNGQKMSRNTDTDINVDIDTLCEFHEVSSLNEMSELDKNKIIDILGGVDEILTNYIKITKESSNTYNLLNNKQMYDIYKVISKEEEVELNKCINTKRTSTFDIMAAKREESFICDYKYSLLKGHTFLNSIFGKSTTTKIETFIYNKYVFICGCIIALIWFIVSTFISTLHLSLWFFVISIISIFIVSVYLIFLILASNIRAFKLIIKNFDFWIKIYYSISSTIVFTLYSILIDSNTYYIGYEIYFLNVSFILLILIVAYFSSIESHNMSWRAVTCAGIFISILTTGNALKYTFDTTIPDKILVINDQFSFSFISHIASAFQVLSIFLWQQTGKALIKRGTECLSIKIYPKVEWVDCQKYVI